VLAEVRGIISEQLGTELEKVRPAAAQRPPRNPWSGRAPARLPWSGRAPARLPDHPRANLRLGKYTWAGFRASSGAQAWLQEATIHCNVGLQRTRSNC
jgi:hypothetical protein